MANTAELENMSEINGKTVDAIGHMIFQVNMDHFKSPFHVENKGTNHRLDPDVYSDNFVSLFKRNW